MDLCPRCGYSANAPTRTKHVHRGLNGDGVVAPGYERALCEDLVCRHSGRLHRRDGSCMATEMRGEFTIIPCGCDGWKAPRRIPTPRRRT